MTTNSNGILSTKERNKLLLFIAATIILNLVLSQLIEPSSEIRHLNGDHATYTEVKSAAFSTILYSFPLLGFILASLLSFIPYKDLPYKKKYLRFSLLTVLGIQVLISLFGIRNLLLYYF